MNWKLLNIIAHALSFSFRRSHNVTKLARFTCVAYSLFSPHVNLNCMIFLPFICCVALKVRYFYLNYGFNDIEIGQFICAILNGFYYNERVNLFYSSLFFNQCNHVKLCLPSKFEFKKKIKKYFPLNIIITIVFWQTKMTLMNFVRLKANIVHKLHNFGHYVIRSR